MEEKKTRNDEGEAGRRGTRNTGVEYEARREGQRPKRPKKDGEGETKE